MKLTKKLVNIGRGSISSGVVIGGIAQIIVKAEGKLIKKSMKENAGQVYGASTVGYCDDLWILPSGKLERVCEELRYEPNS